jgi:hypothetical protein
MAQSANKVYLTLFPFSLQDIPSIFASHHPSPFMLSPCPCGSLSSLPVLCPLKVSFLVVIVILLA